MAIVTEARPNEICWVDAGGSPLALLTTTFVAVLAMVFAVPALGFFIRPSLLPAVFVVVDLWCWFLVVRSVYLTLRKAQYELVVSSHEIRWGWRHAPDKQQRIPIGNVRTVEYTRTGFDEDEHNTLLITTSDKAVRSIGGAFADHPKHARDILQHFRQAVPTVIVKDSHPLSAVEPP